MDRDPERSALRFSAWGNVFFAALGLGFGLTTRSEAIMLDGYFSLIAFVMSLVTLRVSRLVTQGEDETFHFGYYSFEPLLNTIKGLFILALCAVALVSAVVSLFRGGREVNLGWAVVYSVVAMVGALTLAVAQNRVAKATGSPLLEVDARNWRIDGILSGAVLLAFLGAFLIQKTRWSHLLPYVDPALVAVLIVAVVREPVRIVRDGLGELLYISPPPEVQHEVRQRFDELVADYGFQRTHLRMVKVGRVSYLSAHVVVPEGFVLSRIDELDEIRRRIAQGIQELHPSWTVDTIFVADEALVGYPTPETHDA
jgi:cation diffusion facilitator family transporter